MRSWYDRGMSKDHTKSAPLFWTAPGVQVKVVAVGERKTEERKHLDLVQEHVVLALMESAGMLASVEENLDLVMDMASDQMSPEELEKQRADMTRQIHEGRHEVYLRLDPKSKDLLERAARGDVVLVKGGLRRH